MKISRQFRQRIAGWICPELACQLEDDKTAIRALKDEINVATEQLEQMTRRHEPALLPPPSFEIPRAATELDRVLLPATDGWGTHIQT